MTVHYRYDHNRVYIGPFAEPDPDGRSTLVAPPDISGALRRFVDPEHGWELVQAVDVNGMRVSVPDYHLWNPDWVEAVVPFPERNEPGMMWDWVNLKWWYPDKARPLAAHGEIMLISDQIARLAYTEESDEGQEILRNIHRLFPDAPVRENADGIMEAFHPETGERRMCQPGGVRKSFAYGHDQFGLYIFEPYCPTFLLPHYRQQDNSLPREEGEYPGWWGYKFNVDTIDGELVAVDYSIKIVSRMPELYDLPTLPDGMNASLYAQNLPAGNFMDTTADVYFSFPNGVTDEGVDSATDWLEARGITSPYTGSAYSSIAYGLYGLTFNKADLSPVKAKFYLFSYDRVLRGLLGELVLQGRADLAGYVTPERPTQ